MTPYIEEGIDTFCYMGRQFRAYSAVVVNLAEGHLALDRFDTQCSMLAHNRNYLLKFIVVGSSKDGKVMMVTFAYPGQNHRDFFLAGSDLGYWERIHCAGFLERDGNARFITGVKTDIRDQNGEAPLLEADLSDIYINYQLKYLLGAGDFVVS